LQIELGDFPPVLLAATALAVVTSVTKVVTGWITAAAAGVGPLGRLRAGMASSRGESSRS